MAAFLAQYWSFLLPALLGVFAIFFARVFVVPLWVAGASFLLFLLPLIFPVAAVEGQALLVYGLTLLLLVPAVFGMLFGWRWGAKKAEEQSLSSWRRSASSGATLVLGIVFLVLYALVLAPHARRLLLSTWELAGLYAFFAGLLLGFLVGAFSILQRRLMLVAGACPLLVCVVAVAGNNVPRKYIAPAVLGAEYFPRGLSQEVRVAAESTLREKEGAPFRIALAAAGLRKESESQKGQEESHGVDWHLERLLSLGKKEKSFVVSSWSAPAASVAQFEEALTQINSESAPDLVLLGAGFQESRLNWNSFDVPHMSEAQAKRHLEALWRVRNFPLADIAFESIAFRSWFERREVEKSLRRPDEVPRFSAEEFERAASSLLDSFEERGTTVVCLPDLVPERRSALQEQFQKIFEELCRARQGAFSTLLAGVRFRTEGSGSHFWDFDGTLRPEKRYPLAQELYAVLYENRDRFPAALSQRIAALPAHPFGVHEHFFTAKSTSEALPEEVIWEVNAEAVPRTYYHAVFSADGEFLADKRLREKEPVKVRFRIPRALRQRDFSPRFALRIHPSPFFEDDMLAGSEIPVPVPVSVVSHPEGRSWVQLGSFFESYRYEDDELVLGVYVLDSRTGAVIRRELLGKHESHRLRSIVHQAPWGALVCVLKLGEIIELEDGARNISYIGLENLPLGNEGFVFIGAAGVKPSASWVRQGDRRVSFSSGSDGLFAARHAGVAFGS